MTPGHLQGATLAIAIAGAALAGMALGFVYFAALRRSVEMLVGRRGWRMPVLLGVARLAAAAAVLIGASRFGAATLIATLAGFLLARTVMLRKARSAG